jgi:Xaa-Pro dipeptidase
MTLAAYKAGLETRREGMTQGDQRNDILAACRAIGAIGGVVAVSFGEYTAFPHGSITPLQCGTCSSDELMVGIYGGFGIDREDSRDITDRDARFFTQPSLVIDRPFA